VAITILDVVRWRHRYPDAPRPMAWHTLPAHVVSLHLRAAGRGIIGGEEFTNDGPSLSLAAAGERDGNQMRGLNEAWWCYFSYPDLAPLPGGGGVELRLGGMSLRRNHRRRLAVAEARTLGQRFAEAFAAWRRPDMASRLQATALITGVIAAWCAPPRPHRSSEDGMAARFRLLIEETATDAGVSLAGLVRRLGRADDRLSTLFRDAYGLTPVAYRLQLRLALAGELLSFTDLPLREVAHRSGFGTATHLSHAFKQEHGVSPRAWVQAWSSRRSPGPPRAVARTPGGRVVGKTLPDAAGLSSCPGAEGNYFADG
jgi:AraC-like DNA-binding protein